MSPQTYALSIYRGDSYRWRFVLWLDEDRTQPADLTGCTVAAMIKDAKAGLVPLACTFATNEIDVALSAVSSKTLTANSPTITSTSTWDLQVTYPSGDIHTVVGGMVTVAPDVTP